MGEDRNHKIEGFATDWAVLAMAGIAALVVLGIPVFFLFFR